MKIKLTFLYLLIFCFSSKNLFALHEIEIDQVKLKQQINLFYQKHFDDFKSNQHKLFKYLTQEALNPNKENIEVDFDKNPEFINLLNREKETYYFDFDQPFCPFYKIYTLYQFDHYKNQSLLPYILLFLIKHYPFLQNPVYKSRVIGDFYFCLEKNFKPAEIFLHQTAIEEASELIFKNTFDLGIKIKDSYMCYYHYVAIHDYYAKIHELINPESEIPDLTDFWLENFSAKILDDQISLEELKHFWTYLPYLYKNGVYILGLHKIIMYNLPEKYHLSPDEINLDDSIKTPYCYASEILLQIIDLPDPLTKLNEILATEEKGLCILSETPIHGGSKIDVRIIKFMIKCFEKIESHQD